MSNGFLFWIGLQILLLYQGFNSRNWLYVFLILGIFITGLVAHYKYNLFSGAKKQIRCKHNNLVSNSNGEMICIECGEIVRGG